MKQFLSATNYIFIIMKYFTIFVDAFGRCLLYLHLPHFIPHMCICQPWMIQSQLKFITIQSSGLSSKMHLVHWMVAISILHHLYLSGHHLETTKVSYHKTVFSHAPFHFYLSMHLLDGKGQPLMPISMKTHVPMILLSQQANTILLMLGFPSVINCLFCTDLYITILLNGAV